MRWLNRHIKIVSLVWWLLQAIFWLLLAFALSNSIDYSLLSISIYLTIVSLLTMFFNRDFLVLSGVLLLLYSVLALIGMTMFFLLWGGRSFNSLIVGILFYYTIPFLNFFFSFFLILNKHIRLNRFVDLNIRPCYDVCYDMFLLYVS